MSESRVLRSERDEDEKYYIMESKIKLKVVPLLN
jgi:hypothetical protein